MTHIPQAGNHGLMVSIRNTDPSCLGWEYMDEVDLTPHREVLRERFRPDANGTCTCSPHYRTVPPKFYAEDGPHTQRAADEIMHVMGMWGHQISLEQRLAWYDESAAEELEEHERIWVD